MERHKVIFDVETTGLDPENDEILQFSAINENGEVLMNTYIKPTHHTEWKDAESVNHISLIWLLIVKQWKKYYQTFKLYLIAATS